MPRQENRWQVPFITDCLPCSAEDRNPAVLPSAIQRACGKYACTSRHGACKRSFKEENLKELKGNLGIGHVRYSTTGAAAFNNAQPLVLNYIKGILALAHNGNLVNTKELREELAKSGAIFRTTTDSEVIAYYIARERVNTRTVEEAILRTAKSMGFRSMNPG